MQGFVLTMLLFFFILINAITFLFLLFLLNNACFFFLLIGFIAFVFHSIALGSPIGACVYTRTFLCAAL